eukprot:GFYU01012379.1.p1 GENE.GFYU01012379.1~~GFYU01012379.1.p1  ORF type:complete len:469 (-),score=28.96 GFYU01012379.1:61-1467(-)
MARRKSSFGQSLSPETEGEPQSNDSPGPALLGGQIIPDDDSTSGSEDDGLTPRNHLLAQYREALEDFSYAELQKYQKTTSRGGYLDTPRTESEASDASERVTQVSTPLVNAVAMIQDWYKKHRQRHIFRCLKGALLKAERTMSNVLLAEVCPKEAPILTDPTVEARVRFRLGGTQFPPDIMYKVYTKSKVQYISGQRMILPGSQASDDAFERMGRRKYLDMVIADLEINGPPLTETMNRTKYQKYITQQDELPIQYGGRNNGWRHLFDRTQSYLDNLVRLDLVADPPPYPSLLNKVMLSTDEFGISNMLRHANLSRRSARPITVHGRGTARARKRAQQMKENYLTNPEENPFQDLIMQPYSQLTADALQGLDVYNSASFDQHAYGDAYEGMNRGSPSPPHAYSDEYEVMLGHENISAPSGQDVMGSSHQGGVDRDDDELLDTEAEKLFQWTQALKEDVAWELTSPSVL